MSADAAVPTAVELVARARSLHPLLLQNAPQSDLERVLPDANIRALEAAGLMRLAVPRRYGGFETPLATMLEVTAAVGEACGATAWVLANRYVCTWVAALLSAAGREQIFSAGPDVGIAGANGPSGTSRRTEGGTVLSGKWYYCSGAAHAQWALLGSFERDAADQIVDQWLSLVPVRELTTEDTWFSVGMRGTASICYAAEGVRVPNHRSLSFRRALAGEFPCGLDVGPLYRSSLAAFLPLSLTGPLVGLARAALEHAIDVAPRRVIPGTIFKRQSDSSAFQSQIARAALLIDDAELRMRDAARVVDAAAERQELPPLAARSLLRARAAQIAAGVIEAVGVVMSAHGAGGFAESNPLQRIWRDVNVGARHAVLLDSVALEAYGRVLLGVEPNVALML